MYSQHGVKQKWNTYLILPIGQIEGKYGFRYNQTRTLSFILLEIVLRIISNVKSSNLEIHPCIKRICSG